MRGRIALAAAAWGLLAGLAGRSPAGADTLTALFGEPLVETLHTIDIELGDGVAVYTVRRTLHNDGEERDEAQLDIDLPPGGALTGLRLKSGGSWIDGKLLGEGEARERYLELKQPGEARPRAVALLSWRDRGAGSLEIFPVAAKKTVVVEYTITAPPRVHGGRVWFAVPPGKAGELLRPDLRADGVKDLRKERHADVPAFDVDDDPDGDVYDWDWHSGQAVDFAPPRGEVRARYATLSLDGGRWVWRVELDAPVAWGEKPDGARVVFVLDASHSEGRAGIDAQLALVRGYLSHLPDASVEVVLFRRRAARLFGEFVAATEFDGALDERLEASFVPGNGSHVEAGLALAAGALTGWEGPARIVVMSDEMFRAAYSPDAAIAALAAAPKGTIVHGVVRSATGGPLAEAWAAEAALMPIARATGGTVLEVTGDDPDLGELARITRGLIVPIRLDGFAVVDPGAPIDPEDPDGEPELFGGETWPSWLDEGVSVRRMELFEPPARRPEKLVVRGWLWGKEWTREVPVSAGLSARLPALVIGHPLEERLTDEEGLPLATRAGAVSRWTSYLAEDRRAAPSTDGYDLGVGCSFGSGHGSASCSVRCGVGCGGAGHRDRLAEVLRARTEPGIAACARRAGRTTLTVQLSVETTMHEVVDVHADGAGGVPGLQACVEDVVWGVSLEPSRFRWVQRTFQFEVVIGDGDDAPAEPIDKREWFL